METARVLALPRMRNLESPEVVKLLDRIRFALDSQDDHAEFCLFAREYPRCYRFHMDAADHRLKTIHRFLQGIRGDLLASSGEAARIAATVSEVEIDGVFEHAVFNHAVHQVYWEFESFLSEVCISLDLLARVLSPCFSQESPPSFQRLTRWGADHPVTDILKRADLRWVRRLKDYRDCFTHYTPVDTMLHVTMVLRQSGWELRAKLPVNPNVREILGFRYSRRVELMRYAIGVHRSMTGLDRAVARCLARLFRDGRFPVRTTNLFFVGARFRKPSAE